MTNETSKFRSVDPQKRSALRSKLSAAAQRVFALEGKSYSGFGYHYSLVKTIGGLMYRLNNMDIKYTEDDFLTDEVIYDDLIEQLDTIEREIHSQ